MHHIRLQEITIRNFKGIRDITIPFQDETNILGANATGKTTVFDAFTWLLFGKDATDRKDFNIKPLDTRGKATDRTENEVSAIITIDGRSISIKRVHKEKWQKKRGEETPEFTGNETLYYYNDVPLQQKDYTAKIDEILSESVFKLITNPLYFNQLKWQDRRAILLKISPEINDQELAGTKPEFIELLNQLSGKTFKEYRDQIAEQKKKLKDELKLIPARIDEINRTRSSIDIPNYTQVEADIQTYKDRLVRVEQSIEDKNSEFQLQYNTIQGLQSKKFGLQQKLQQEQNKSQIAANENKLQLERDCGQIRSDIATLKSEIDSLSRGVSSNNNQINLLNDENNRLRQEWHDVNGKELVFNEDEFTCPACQQPLPDDKVNASKEAMTAKFNTDKSRKLEAITKAGEENAVNIKRFESKNGELQNSISSKRTELLDKEMKLNDLNDRLSAEKDNPATVSESDEEKRLKKEILSIVIPEAPRVDIGELKLEKDVIIKNIDELKAKLQTKTQIDLLNKRFKELEEEEKIKGQLLSGYEKTEFLMEQFQRDKMTLLESRVNGMFKYVQFKMFDTQVNGAQVEICDTTYLGVPFSDLNTAGKILVGIDIINVLSNYYGVSAPVFLDNRESVTEIPETEAQVVNLVVDPAYTTLSIKPSIMSATAY